jgi:hypothetical protein
VIGAPVSDPAQWRVFETCRLGDRRSVPQSEHVWQSHLFHLSVSAFITEKLKAQKPVQSRSIWSALRRRLAAGMS